ncbi:sugar phosphate isomerase/epimerase family protein [Cohnella boryungensis]|uniref:Sugar phosphate isomerase/epimerase family protein n=1 Tax=Cohnella boryungensis TaxID=768479 RepID=A0ABV8S3N4_9BACL
MGLELGLQLYSVRQAYKHDVTATLERVAEIGYKNLELALQNRDANLNAGGLSASEFRKRMERLGLKTVSCHAMVHGEDSLPPLLDFLTEVGSPTLIIPIAFFESRRQTLEYCDKLNRYGEAARKKGIDFYYHNHFQEFQRFEGEMIMDTMLAHTDPSLVKFELDTYWTVRGGEDPLQWLDKLGERCDLVHQKDLPASVSAVNYFDVYGKDSRITLDTLYQTQDPAQFTESGEGVLDIGAYIGKLRSLGHAKTIFVEQDMTSRDEFESVSISYRNMTKLLGE